MAVHRYGRASVAGCRSLLTKFIVETVGTIIPLRTAAMLLEALLLTQPGGGPHHLRLMVSILKINMQVSNGASLHLRHRACKTIPTISILSLSSRSICRLNRSPHITTTRLPHWRQIAGIITEEQTSPVTTMRDLLLRSQYPMQFHLYLGWAAVSNRGLSMVHCL